MAAERKKDAWLYAMLVVGVVACGLVVGLVVIAAHKADSGSHPVSNAMSAVSNAMDLLDSGGPSVTRVSTSSTYSVDLGLSGKFAVFANSTCWQGAESRRDYKGSMVECMVECSRMNKEKPGDCVGFVRVANDLDSHAGYAGKCFYGTGQIGRPYAWNEFTNPFNMDIRSCVIPYEDPNMVPASFSSIGPPADTLSDYNLLALMRKFPAIIPIIMNTTGTGKQAKPAQMQTGPAFRICGENIAETASPTEMLLQNTSGDAYCNGGMSLSMQSIKHGCFLDVLSSVPKLWPWNQSEVCPNAEDQCTSSPSFTFTCHHKSAPPPRSNLLGNSGGGLCWAQVPAGQRESGQPPFVFGAPKNQAGPITFKCPYEGFGTKCSMQPEDVTSGCELEDPPLPDPQLPWPPNNVTCEPCEFKFNMKCMCNHVVHDVGMFYRSGAAGDWDN